MEGAMMMTGGDVEEEDEAAAKPIKESQ